MSEEFTLDLWPSRARINLEDPNPDDYRIEDIAWGLSWEMRFANHIPRFYSVAEHCVNAARLAMSMLPELGPTDTYAVAQRALLHDAAEGVGWRDLPSPIKKLIPDYKRYEKLHQRAIYVRFGLPARHERFDGLVKSIDDRLYHIEHRYLRHDEKVEGYTMLQFWDPDAARAIYTGTFRDLFPAAVR